MKGFPVNVLVSQMILEKSLYKPRNHLGYVLLFESKCLFESDYQWCRASFIIFFWKFFVIIWIKSCLVKLKETVIYV